MQYRTPAGFTAGVVHDEQILTMREPRTLLELLEAGESAMQDVGEATRAQPAAVLSLDPSIIGPSLQPRSIRDFLCFLDHLRRCRGTQELEPVWNEIPAFYFSNCDWSARDLQMREMQLSLGPAKGKDGATTLGPMFVSRDELEPHRRGNSFHLEMRAFLNGERVGGDWLSRMDWSFGEIAAYASRGTELVAGDVLGSGTVPTGCPFEHFITEPDRFRGWLQPGDVVRLEVDLLGHIEQRIAAGPEPSPVFESVDRAQFSPRPGSNDVGGRPAPKGLRRVDEMQVNPAGELDRNALRAPFWALG